MIQADRNDQRLDKKLEILTRSIPSTYIHTHISFPLFNPSSLPSPTIHHRIIEVISTADPPRSKWETKSVYEDPDPTHSRIQELEEENQTLRRKLSNMERELHGRSPTKPKSKKGGAVVVLKEDGEEGNSDHHLLLEKAIAGLKDMGLNNNNNDENLLPFRQPPPPSSVKDNNKTPGKRQRYVLLFREFFSF